MARKSPSRLDKRREVEAAEALEAAGGTTAKKTKKKAAKKTKKKAATRSRAKAKTSARKRIVWGVFNGSMKEEARFPYAEREAAELKVEQLRVKSPKKMFFIQPIKEEMAEVVAAANAAAEEESEE